MLRRGFCNDALVVCRIREPTYKGESTEFDLLRDAEGVIDLDPEVADRALQLRVAEQQLRGRQVAGLLVKYEPASFGASSGP